ncbi:hypothetical protein U9K52_08635 [Chryseobacterium sp. MHB01]|uniref:hypothetical protein n=1 Tax=Chryseobacterium sp. MHB01 TaxID=3109433 RepID=UPI002AFF79DD|nr:hypothetical protein [Chryseobacterium sp. MHB01]MEA1848973.1 hypothetical protein [Chryseobacterium sp. MHB01]
MIEFKWIYIEKEKPICTQTGSWDGKKSNELIVRDFKGNHHIAVCYQGFIDGAYFCDFYTFKNEHIIEGVMFWAIIPD